MNNNFLQKLKQVLQLFYPTRLILMILYLLICSMLINYDVFDSRELIIYACWLIILLLPSILLKKKFLYIIVVVFFFIEGLLNLLHLLVIKGPLSASSIFVILNTNYSESQDFMSLKINYRLLLVLPYIYLFIGAIKYKSQTILLQKSQKIIMLVLVLGAVIFQVENAIHQRFLRKSTPQTIKALFSFIEENKNYKLLKNRTIQKVSASIDQSEKGRVFVLIIGESASRNHMSLYGAKAQTNPLLRQRNDIVAYSNVVAPYSTTLQCVLSLFTESNLENNMKIDQSLSLLDVFHSLDFETYWLSNQSPIGVYDNAIYNIAKTAKHQTFVNYSSSSSFESLGTISYDENLLKPLEKALENNHKNKFIVVHLMGNHFEYAKRYPQNFAKFNTKGDKKAKIIGHYQNAMLYNDYILNTVFNQLEKSAQKNPQSNYSAIYLSDHAENVYDYHDEVGHDYVGNLPKANVEIPFIVWLSQAYKSNYPQVYQQIEAAKNSPFVSDDLFHAALDLNQISAKFIFSNRSVFNSNYNAQRQRILEDKMDYDQKK